MRNHDALFAHENLGLDGRALYDGVLGFEIQVGPRFAPSKGVQKPGDLPRLSLVVIPLEGW